LFHLSVILVKFGARLRELRKATRLSQEKLALQSDLDRSYVGQVERGERNISSQNIAKLARAFDVAPHELLRFSHCGTSLAAGPDDEKEGP
jgi:transcriptional regulator with XRE-family HTH domain